jgi:DNA segregation ATPase FtsK/SpoIIIE-like protein
MTREQLRSLPDELSRPLLAIDRKVRTLAVLRGVAVLISLLIAGVSLALLADLLVELSVPVRIGLLAGVGALAAGVAVWDVARPLVRGSRPEDMAALIETAHPELHERLTSTIELLRPDIPEAHKGSALMRELLTKQTTQVVHAADFGDAADDRPAQRAGWFAVAAAVLVIAPLLYSRDGYTLLLTRFFAPWDNLERVSNLYFAVADGDRTVPRGSDVAIVVEPRWRTGEEPPPEEVWLNWKNAGGEADARRMLWHADRKVYAATLPHVFHPFTFDVSSGSARTREYRINVVEAPAIASLVLDIQPPTYTGLPARRIDGAVGETKVFERSRLTLELQFNKPLAAAEVRWFPIRSTGAKPPRPGAVPAPEETPARTTPLVLTADRTGASLAFEALPELGGRFKVRITDEHGLTNLDEPERTLRVEADLAPTIAFADQVESPQARPDDLLTLPVTASDDVAVDKLELHFEVIPSGRKGVVAAEDRLLGAKGVDYAFRLDLKTATDDLGVPLSLKHGDAVTVRARALDERPIPGPNESWTDDRVIILHKDAAPYSFGALAQTREQWRELIESIKQELEINRDATRRLQQAAGDDAKRKQPFGRETELPQLAAQQREQGTRLEQLAALFEQSPLYERLAERAQNIAREELTKAPEKVDQVPAAEPSKKDDLLGDSYNEVKQALKELDEVAKSFESLAALERDLSEVQRLADRAQRLSEDAQALDQQRRNPPAEQTPQQQQARDAALEAERQTLQQEHQQLAADLEELVEERPEILNAARERQFDLLRQLAEEALQIAQPQEELAGALEQQHREQLGELAQLADRQQALNQQAEQLAATAEKQHKDQLTQKLDRQPLQSALEELLQGDAAAAAPQQDRAAESLETLSNNLAKGAEPPAEPPEGTPPPQPTAAQKLGQQAETLAKEQRQLAADVRAAEQRMAANSQPQPSVAQSQTPPAQSTPPGEPTGPPMTSPSGEPLPGQPQTEPATTPVEQAAQAIARQQQIARDAAEIALNTAAETGPMSPETEQAVQFAEQATHAAQEATTGQFQQASQQAEQATQAGEQAARQLAEAGQGTPQYELGQQAGQLAQQQQQLAQELSALSENPEARAAVQSQVQQQMAQQSAGVAEQLGQIAEQLGAQPLDRPTQGRQAGEARQSAQQGSQAIEQSASQIAQQQPRQAAQQAETGAAELREAAEQALRAAGKLPKEPSPVPGQVGQQITDAMRQLQQAGQQLAQMPQPNGQSGQPGEQSPNGQPMGQSLNQAAEQLGFMPGAQQGQQSNQQASGQSQGEPSPDGESKDTGANQLPRLTQLELQLQGISSRNWGQLQERLQTNVLESNQRRTGGDYGQVIQRYFEEVSRNRRATPSD